MLTQDPVKIPDIPGKISFKRKGDTEYVQYLTGYTYKAEKSKPEAERVLIGKRSKEMPGLMFPNDHYYQYFKEDGSVVETMTAEEVQYARNNGIYEMYSPFFDGLYYEIKQQTRKNPHEPVNPYKAEIINKVLQPLLEMMRDEVYVHLLGIIRTKEDGEEKGMNYGDVMLLLTHYKSALTKYRRSHMCG